MAHIREHYGSYQCLIRIKGHPTLAKSFKSKTDAKTWALQTELKIRREEAGILKIKYPSFKDTWLIAEGIEIIFSFIFRYIVLFFS